MKKSTRFEVFKRDKFACQYCGRSAPDVVLHVDHIQPQSKGGEDDLLNLVTSCADCNLGKSNRLLSDDAAIKQRKKQLDELQERREQLEMLMDWQRSLIDLEGEAVTQIADLWCELVPGYHLNDNGLKNLRQWVKTYDLLEVIESMKIATSQYLKYEDDVPTKESVEHSFRYIPKIANVRRSQKDKPYLQRLFYMRGIFRNRLAYVDERHVIELAEGAIRGGAPVETIVDFAKKVKNWTNFRATMEDWAEGGYYGER